MANSEQINPGSVEIYSEVDAVIKRYAEGMLDAEAMIQKTQMDYLKELEGRRESLRTESIKRILEAERLGVVKTEQEKAAIAQAVADEQRKADLKAQSELLKQLSTAQEAARKKELEVLQKKVNHQKLVNDYQKKAAAAKEPGASKKDKQAAEEAKRKLKESDKANAKDAVADTFKKGFADFKRQQEEGNAIAETAAKNTETAMKSVGKAITAGLNAINNSIATYAKHQTAINARLNGAEAYNKLPILQAYDEIAMRLSMVAYSPLLRAEDLYANVSELVNQGIVTNVEQRAFFQTVKDGIVGTFDVNNESLKRIIRIQQNDSTAARMGLEAYLNEFLNTYVENTEYLQATFDNVAASLVEASSLLSYNAGGDVSKSLEFEYQVQKWLGTLTGLGLSDEAAQSIASAIGQLGSGDVEGLSGNAINNLLIMGANRSGSKKSYSEMLSEGLDAVGVNDLMYGIVDYMHELGSSGSNVVKNQLAKTFGLSVSDIVAAGNISDDSLVELRGETLSYKGMYEALSDNFDQLIGRTGLSNMLQNLMANFTYQTGANIAANPALYAMWTVTDLIKNATGGDGIAVPYISAMGNGFDLNADITNLMQMAIAGTGLLGGIGGIIAGLGSVGKGSLMLTALGVNARNAEMEQIGGGLGTKKGSKRESGDTSSEASYVGNTDGQSYADSAMNEANDDAQKKLDQKLEETEDPITKYLEEEAQLKVRLSALVDTTGSINANMRLLTSKMIREEVGWNIGEEAKDVSATLAASPKPENSALTSNNPASNSDSVAANQSLDTSAIGMLLSDVEFTTGFKSIVENVAKIAGKEDISLSNSYNTYGSEGKLNSNQNVSDTPNSSGFDGITGFTQSSKKLTI